MLHLLIAVCILAAGSSSFATPIVHSRNMPAHCEFVYQVYSEIRIEWPSNTTGLWLDYRLYHEYEKTWETRDLEPADCDGASCAILLALESMSTAQRFLYRRLQLQFVDNDGQSVSPRYESSFGREFGEPCYHHPEETPFRSREVAAVLP